MPAEIYLIRHGETEWNKQRRCQGSKDSPLTPLGRAHAASSARILARVLGEKRSMLTFQASPLGRTLETAAIIQRHCAFDAPVIEPRLREMSFGTWEGLTREEIITQYTAQLWEARAAPDGETYDACKERTSHWLAEQSGVVVAISHGVTSRVLRGHYMGLSREETLQLPVPQGIVWRLHRGNVDVLEY